MPNIKVRYFLCKCLFCGKKLKKVWRITVLFIALAAVSAPWEATFTVQLGSPVVLSEVRLSMSGEVNNYPGIVEDISGLKPERGAVLGAGEFQSIDIQYTIERE